MRLQHTVPILAFCLCLGLGIRSAGGAESLHAWLVPAPRLAKEAYFSNLQNGDSIETPFVLRFGLTGIGIAPIVKPVANAGHHHLLVNRGLPLEFSHPLPFNDQYMHFGKGQMETVLNFAPGKYQLRLVLANEKHIPNFVYSKPVDVTVTKKNDNVDPKSLIKKGVLILGPKAGATVTTPFRVQFHASGFNISNSEVTEKGSGHFRLRLKNEAGREEVIPFANGHTEAWFQPPPGLYTARLDLIDNAASDQVLASSEPVTFKVAR